MTSSLLGISVTGLKVSQAHLSTAGHNIANAGVDGYSRQRAEAVTNPATLLAGNFVGNGANIESIKRIVNEFVTTQLRQDTSLYKSLEANFDNITLLDGLLADSSTGLSSALESFFAAMQNGADDPTSIPARQLILSEADNLADRFNTLFNRFGTIEKGVNDQLKSAVAQVNALTNNIANLNLKISNAMGVGNGSMPNDLLDQRDEALRELSELVSLNAYDQGNGQINIVIGGGQNLVVGTESRELKLVASEDDPTRTEIVFMDNRGGQVITDRISGGVIGGLLDFRDTTMANTYNQFGRIAVVMADTFNQVNQMGVNLENQFGGLFFYDVNSASVAQERVVANSNNAPPKNAQMSVYIEDSQQLTTSDYEVSFSSGGLFRIERLDDGKIVSSGILTGTFPLTATFDGLELVFDGGTFANGDSFKLQPVKTGGRDFSSLLVSAQEIAFASPLLTDASLGNLGSGTISPGQVLSLTDANGEAIPLLSTPGEMNPPLLVRFTTPYTYDVFDGSDPGNPVDLDPPIRNQRFIPGIPNDLFSTDPGGTMVTTAGEMVGLPVGRTPASTAAIQVAGAVAPSFAVSDFSGANQFSFDVVVSNTLGGVNNSTTTVNISSAAITDNNTLLQEINSQLTASNVRAVIVDNGAGVDTLAFQMLAPGDGDISLQNYSGPAGPSAADGLLGFGISTAAPFTTVANADGRSGYGTQTNGYPAEALTITQAPENAGTQATSYNVFTGLNASARATASALGNIPGVSANALTYVELSNFQLSLNEPVQLSLNGQELIEYVDDPVSGDRILAPGIPDPVSDANGFQQYLADRINSLDYFSDNSIYAVAARDNVSGNLELRVYSTLGDDLNVGMTALNGNYLDVSDGENPATRLQSVSAAVQNNIVVGGRIDVSLAEGMSLSSFPPVSMLFGNTGASDFAKSTYYGIQASINGIPQVGDTFTMDFNQDGAYDNRNALRFVGLQAAGTVNGGLESYGEAYGTIVERIGIETSSVITNKDAADQVLRQSQGRRDSISGVNLDEEAADLIRFEQMFSANAQVISVARDLFDRLLGSF